MKSKILLYLSLVTAIFSTGTTSPSINILPRLSKGELIRGFVLPTVGALSVCGAIEWYKINYTKPMIHEANPTNLVVQDGNCSSWQLIKNNPKSTLGAIIAIAAVAYIAYKKRSRTLIDSQN